MEATQQGISNSNEQLVKVIHENILLSIDWLLYEGNTGT